MRTILPISLLLLVPFRAPAPVMPAADLNRHVQQASDIVVGTMLGSTVSSAGTLTSATLDLHIERVLKGDLTPGSEIAARLQGQSSFVQPVATQSPGPGKIRGIWFLNSSVHPAALMHLHGASGELFDAMVVLPATSPVPEPGATPAESVRNEIVAAIRSVAAANAPIQTLADDLRTLDPSITKDTWRSFARDSSPQLSVAGLAGLIEANDPGGVKLAAERWDELAAANNMQRLAGVLMGYSNDADPDAVRALASIALKCPPALYVRENASYALRAIHTKETIPALARLISDKDDLVRINALAGLCLFVRNAPVVTPQAVVSMAWMQSREPAPYLNADTRSHCLLGGLPRAAADTERYISFWEAWWTEHRADFDNR